MTNKLGLRPRLLWGGAVLIGFAVLYWALIQSGVSSTLTDKQALREWVEQLGIRGPVVIIVMMIMTIVMSPIPSGPIAMVAGAVYGPLWGTVYVVIGAGVGALCAFCIARLLGYEVIQRWSRTRPILAWLGKERSQTRLMLVIFASRLVPLISFAAISYTAGLTPLAFWRFAMATVVGVIPTAYLFVRFGEVLMAADSLAVMAVLILISSVTLLPILLKVVWSWYRKRKTIRVHAVAKR